jgi:hypothetical protein
MNISTGVIEWLLPGAGVAAKGGNYSLVLEEDLTAGQLIGSYSLHCLAAGAGSWRPCAMGAISGAIESAAVPGIGHKRILMLALTAPLQGLRVVVRSNFATGTQIPALRSISLYDWSGRRGSSKGCDDSVLPTLYE